MNLSDCIGKTIKKILLEWFYMNNEPISIIRLYVQIDDVYLNVLCSEENVYIKKQENCPVKMDVENFVYIPIEKNIDWLIQNKILSIKYLVDSINIKRGILFLFENHHNFAYYNMGYEIKDEGIFEIDVNIEQLPYILDNVDI